MKRPDWKAQGVLTVKLSQKDVEWIMLGLTALRERGACTAQECKELRTLGGWLRDQATEARKGVRCH